MNNLQSRRTLTILLVILIVNLVLALIFREFIRDNVLVPILYLVFYIRLFLRSLGETCLWPVLVLLVMVISLRFFRQRKNERSKTYGYREEPASIDSGRIAFWLRFIKHRSLGMENLSLISFRLKELVSSVVAYQENLTQKELEDSISSGMLHLPHEVQIYLDPKNQVTGVPTKKASIIKKFLTWIEARTAVDQDTSLADLREVVEYLEEQLEIKHDDGN